MFVSALRKREHNSDTDAARARLASAGRVSAGVELMIADLDGTPLPSGQTGEIWLRTRATIGGYYNNPRPRQRSSKTAIGSRAMSAMSTTLAICSSSTARRT